MTSKDMQLRFLGVGGSSGMDLGSASAVLEIGEVPARLPGKYAHKGLVLRLVGAGIYIESDFPATVFHVPRRVRQQRCVQAIERDPVV